MRARCQQRFVGKHATAEVSVQGAAATGVTSVAEQVCIQVDLVYIARGRLCEFSHRLMVHVGVEMHGQHYPKPPHPKHTHQIQVTRTGADFHENTHALGEGARQRQGDMLHMCTRNHGAPGQHLAPHTWCSTASSTRRGEPIPMIFTARWACSRWR